MRLPRPTCCSVPDAGLAAVSGLLLASLFAPFYAWLLGPLALAPLLAAVLRSRGPREAAWLGFITGMFFYPLALRWMVNVLNASVLVFWPVFACWLALFTSLLRALWVRLEGRGNAGALAWTAAAGVFLAGIEYFRAEVWFLSCPWLVLGYSQAPNDALYQTLSVWGVYGLSAFLAAFAAALALASARKARLPALLMLALFAAAGYLGMLRYKNFPAEAGRPVKAALVQAERADLKKLLSLSLTPEARSADLLVWPENAFLVPGDDFRAYSDLITKGLKGSRAVAALGSGIKNFENLRNFRRENFMLFFDGGKVIGRYDKMHPVPFVETGLKGRRRATVVPTRLGVLGPQICYDLAFENGSRQAAELGAEILVSPTLDPEEWGELQHIQHSDMSSARAVETGLWLVRAASSGRSQIIDPAGRVKAQLENWKTGTLTGIAYLAKGGTFYTRAGWLFAPLSLLLTAAAAFLLWRTRNGAK